MPSMVYLVLRGGGDAQRGGGGAQQRQHVVELVQQQRGGPQQRVQRTHQRRARAQRAQRLGRQALQVHRDVARYHAHLLHHTCAHYYLKLIANTSDISLEYYLWLQNI